MRRVFLTLPLLCVPLVAAGQAVANGPQDASGRLWIQPADSLTRNADNSTTVPLWRGADGHMASLRVGYNMLSAAQQAAVPLQFRAVDTTRVRFTDLQYGLSPNLQAFLGVGQYDWVNNQAPRVVNSELGVSYDTGVYSLGVSVGNASVPDNATLPRLLPANALPGVNGLPGFDGSTQLNTRGRLALDGSSGIDLGASLSRVRLLPGNVLGTSTVDQKALSFGVDHGVLSGGVVGRVMQPEPGMTGIPGSYNDPSRRWSSIDLGVTWRLPWQGQLSIGAQNVWSSGNSVNTPVGPEPDQSRTPYVQYHQDL